MKTPSPKQDWPKTVTVGNATVKVYKRITGSGNTGFQIVYHDTTGKRKFESESDEAEAMKLAAKKAETLSSFGARVAGTSPDQMAEFVRVSDLLKPFGVALGAVVERVAGWLTKHGSLDAIDRALIAGPVAGGVVTAHPVAEVTKEVLELKESNGASAVYMSTLKCLFKKFAKDFTCNIATVTTAQVQAWIDGQKLPGATYNNLRATLFMLFAYSVRREYCAKNPIVNVEKRKVRDGVTGIFTPDEMLKLLIEAKNGLQARMAISAFAGVRAAEAGRLMWSNVDFAGGNIVLDAGQAKTASRRIIPIPDNLRAWLSPYKGSTGKIWKGTSGKLVWEQAACAKRAGVTWHDNALRHSFCSYRLAQCHDAAKVAFEAGNSAAMVHRHYKALVTEQSAREWFAIMPPATPATKPV